MPHDPRPADPGGVDRYLQESGPGAAAALEATFGRAPALEVPARDEWERG
ncbi:MAG TPA: hypothetical protein VNO17_02055 [Actinomycetota bacterium]|nr:hypothetical protein [Actinomycetota bacterium]